MIEKYCLNGKELPTIPIPHDCVIKDIKINDRELVLIFEDDISYHDSIKSIRPDAKSLIIRFHFRDNLDDLLIYEEFKKKHLFKTVFYYRRIDEPKYIHKAIERYTKTRMEYLFHNIGYCSTIVRLWSKVDIVMNITADYIEYEWK